MSDISTKREFSTEERERLAKSGAALPDGSYPIVTKEDLANAIHAYGRNPTPRVKNHIIKRARALGAASMLPEDWGGAADVGKSLDMNTLDATLIYEGGAIKALGEGRIGGIGVTFGGKDLTDEYFVAETYFGARGGDGADCLFHHGLPLKKDFVHDPDHLFAPVKVTREDYGLFVETVLDMADEYERKVYELIEKGKLGWSSGAPSHMVRKDASGLIKRWPISEFSMTPTPAEPRNRAIPLKTLLDDAGLDDRTEEERIDQLYTERGFEKLLRDAGFTRGQSVAIARYGFKSAILRESEDDQRDAENQAEQARRQNLLRDLGLQLDTGVL